jgi:hypothetical protein
MQRIDSADAVLQPTGRRLTPVKERTVYPEQFPILLREILQGQTIREAADSLGIDCDVLVRVLDGSWRPPKSLRERLGLRIAYIVPKDLTEAE